MTTPSQTPFFAKFRFPGAIKKPENASAIQDHSGGESSGDSSAADFTPTSFLIDNDSGRDQASIDTDSDFTASTGILASRRNSIIDSVPATPSTATVATTLNSLELHSPPLYMVRTNESHHEQQHAASSSPTSFDYSPLMRFSRQGPQWQTGGHVLDFDVPIPSPALHMSSSSYSQMSTVFGDANAISTDATTFPNGQPPSPILPPLPPKPQPQAYTGGANSLGSRGANTIAYIPRQVKAGRVGKLEANKAAAYNAGTSRIPLRTQEVSKIDGGDQEDFFLSPSTPSKIPKPHIQHMGSERTATGVQSSAAGGGSLSFPSRSTIMNEATAIDEGAAGWKKFPDSFEDRSKPGESSGSTLMNIIASLRTDEDVDDDTAATPIPSPKLRPRMPPQHEDSGIAFGPEPSGEDPDTHSTFHETMALAAGVLGTPITINGSIVGNTSPEAGGTQRAFSHSFIWALEQRVETLKERKDRFEASLRHMRRYVSFSQPDIEAIGTQGHLHGIHQLYKESGLRLAESLARETDLELVLTNCLIALVKTRLRIGMSQTGHDRKTCNSCRAADDFEKQKAEKRFGRVEVDRNVGEKSVSEEKEGCVVSHATSRVNHGKHENQAGETSARQAETVVKAMAERSKTDGQKKTGITEGAKENLNEMKHDEGLAGKHPEDVKEKGKDRAVDTSTVPTVLEASQTKGRVQDKEMNPEDANFGEEKDEDDLGQDPEWMSQGVYASVGRAITTRNNVPNSKNALSEQDKKIPEAEQLRRINRAEYSFLDNPPKRSISPPLLATKGPSQVIPSIRKGRPLPTQLTRVRAAHEIIFLETQVPRIIDGNESLWKSRWRSIMQRRQFNGSQGRISTDASMKREDAMIFELSRSKSKEQHETKDLGGEDDGKKDDDKRVGRVKKMAEAMESKRSSEEALKPAGSKGQVMPPKMIQSKP